MMRDFTAPSTRALDKQVNACGNIEEIRAVAKGLYVPVPPPRAQSQTPDAPKNHIRVIYPSGNARFELYGVSEEDLDNQERQIREMYGS